MVNSVVIRDYIQALNVSSGLLLRMASKDINHKKKSYACKNHQKVITVSASQGRSSLARAQRSTMGNKIW